LELFSRVLRLALASEIANPQKEGGGYVGVVRVKFARFGMVGRLYK
jgi:hypothetical protein